MAESSHDRSLSIVDEDGVEIPIDRVSESPCRAACPAGVNVKSYVTLIAAGMFREALEVVRRRNPLPGICGRVCTHPCEATCNRGEVDAPVAIRDLKRFIADWELAHPEESQAQPAERKYEERVAIVGAGPAGLTAANDLVRRGYGVTIFEALPRPGGMMVAGIPAFRLPRDVIDKEIGSILDLGVELRTGTPLGPDRTIGHLMQDEGYSAVFLAVGAHRGRKLGIPGEEGTFDAVEFLRRANLEGAEKLGDDVVVIGGGNSAIDAARTSIRLGSERVTIVYRRTREEMPADEGEVDEALEEGIGIHYLASPVEMVKEEGRIVGLRCIRNELGEPDESGRRRPVPVEGSEFVVPCDALVAAISQQPDLSFLPDDHTLEITRWGTIVADERTLETSMKGVFVGGDAYTGPASVIDAMRDGHRAAISIDAFLRGKSIEEAHERAAWLPGDREIPRDIETVEPGRRFPIHHKDPDFRRRSFDEVADGFTPEEARAEAARCLHCGPCSECDVCLTVCDQQLYVAAGADGSETFIRLPLGTPAFEKAKAHLEALLKENVDEGSEEKKVKLAPVTSYVLEALCRGCGDCTEVCDYDAPRLIEKSDGRLVSHIDEVLCRGCGTCVALCPSSAIVARHFTDDWVEDRLKKALLGV